jgi:hypothetical protein
MVGVPTLSPAPCTTSYLSCPPFLPARPTSLMYSDAKVANRDIRFGRRDNKMVLE